MTRALSAACGECGKEVWPEQFHDYVECIRQRSFRLRVEPVQALRDIALLLAYIDRLEPQRALHHLQGLEAEAKP